MLSVKYNSNVLAGWKHVNRCALHVLALLWLTILVVILVVHFIIAPQLQLSLSVLRTFTWVVFFFVAMTVAWVVLSRAVSRFTRTLLFCIWVLSLIAVFSWNAFLADEIPVQTLLFVSIALMGFLVLSALSWYIPMHRPFVVVAVYTLTGMIIAASVSGAASLFTGAPMEDFILVGIAAAVYLLIHLVAIWTYLHQNPRVWMVENTCVFAAMSPFTEAIDSFVPFVACRTNMK